MNIFKINPWIFLMFFTLPCLFFFEEPLIVSILFFLFFLLFLFFLSEEEYIEAGQVALRNKIECIVLLLIYGSYPIFKLFGKEILFSENLKTIFSILYFFIFIDLANNLSNLLLRYAHKTILKKILIFLSLLLPFFGVYYLRYLYLQSLENLSNKSQKDLNEH